MCTYPFIWGAGNDQVVIYLLCELALVLQVAVNLKGVFLTCQAAARVMVAQRTSQPSRPPGSIITMSSVNAVMAIPSIAGEP
jgi:NAD(P)-dependent dehydrogenase (short-subunit alcohol dehydrogenase family)